jgi:hypothetical protein
MAQESINRGTCPETQQLGPLLPNSAAMSPIPAAMLYDIAALLASKAALQYNMGPLLTISRPE